MEEFVINHGNGSRLASLIDHRLRGNQRRFLVSIDSSGAVGDTEREQAGKELIALLDAMGSNVGDSGPSEAELDTAIDETIADVRASRPECDRQPKTARIA